MFRNIKKSAVSDFLAWAALLGVGLTVAPAAQAVIFEFTSDHCTGGCGTPPFGTVDVTQVGTDVHFIVDLADGINWAQTGAVDFQLFKFNGTGITVGDITVVQTFTGETLLANTGVFNGDGTGPFSFGISCSTCGNGNLGIAFDLDFTVANATIAELTAANALGNIFVADIFSSETGNTGPVDVTSTVPSVPEPSALALLGLGLVAVATVRRRKQSH